MRVSRRYIVVFITLLLCAGLLFLLSALIETPAPEAEAAEPPAAHGVTAFVSMPPAPTTADGLPAAAWLRVAALFAAVVAMLPRLLCTTDANGRVLRKRRYVRCFHLVFRQEIACG